MNTPFPHLPLLDHLRPEPGWQTDAAVVSTYSAQMPVVAAVLLALAGEADESGSGTRVGLVRALTGLRGKVHVVLQSGRLSQGKHDAAITGLFDQFLLQVPWDESAGPEGKSWHAKFALTRQVPIDPKQDGERWVFLLGSRNLTLDTSWDIGFVLKGHNGSPPHGQTTQRLGGIADMVGALRDLFPALRNWQRFESGLRRTTAWRVPKDLNVSELRLMLPAAPNRAMPAAPSGLKRLVAVSPFLDKASVQALMKWPMVANGRRQLLSTRVELNRVLAGVKPGDAPELLSLAEPTFAASDAAKDSDDSELDPEHIGLHAKLIYAEHGAGGSIWLGSPNLTQRAWTRNAEAVVCVDSASRAGFQLLEAGINALLDCASEVRAEALQSQEIDPSIAERLAAARNCVAARLAEASQKPRKDGVVHVASPSAPNPEDAAITLSCGQINGPMVRWLPSARTLDFPVDQKAVESDCVRCRLELDGEGVDWLQLIPFDPPLDVETRNTRVLGEYLGSRQMLSWIHGVLSGYSDGDEGGPWNAPHNKATGHRKGAPMIELPTLEQVLRMWLREPSRLDEVDRILKFQQSNRGHGPTDSDAKLLERFASTWNVIRKSLPGAGS